MFASQSAARAGSLQTALQSVHGLPSAHVAQAVTLQLQVIHATGMSLDPPARTMLMWRPYGAALTRLLTFLPVLK